MTCEASRVGIGGAGVEAKNGSGVGVFRPQAENRARLKTRAQKQIMCLGQSVSLLFIDGKALLVGQVANLSYIF